MPESPQPSLIKFERAVAIRNFEDAAQEALYILNGLQLGKGSPNGFDMGTGFHGSDEDVYQHVATRFAAAFGDMVTAPELKLAPDAVELLLIFHRWTDMMFRLSGFRTSAHLFGRLPKDDAGNTTLNVVTLIQLLLFYSPSSNLNLNLDQAFKMNGLATVVALLGYLASRSCITENANAFRDRALEWLPGKLAAYTFGVRQLGFASDVYMHCSYAFTPDKHRIKADLIAQMRKMLIQVGAPEAKGPQKPRERRRVVVVCEHFHSKHSVFRTHSRAVRSLRERFEVIGIGYGAKFDDDARECFDDVISYIESDDFVEITKRAAEDIAALEPDMVFFLGVGMSSVVIGLASLRLAPIQCVSYGHTATTMSPTVDYMILPDDFIGSADVYSERLLRFPPAAIPYAAPVPSETPPPPRVPRQQDGIVRIAVPASIMKINAPFLKALAKAAEQASHPVEFHFFPLAAIAMSYYHADLEIRRILPQAIVNHETDRQTYLTRIGACEFFVSPFPYGNMNSIVDAMHMGVPGVCLDGAEAHSHADLAIFRRLGLPEELCTTTVEDYVASIVRLIDDADWRKHCQTVAENVDLHATMYAGNERLFAEEIDKLFVAAEVPA